MQTYNHNSYKVVKDTQIHKVLSKVYQKKQLLCLHKNDQLEEVEPIAMVMP